GQAQEDARVAFLETLRELGYQPGRDLLISWYFPASTTQPLAHVPAEMLASQPDIILVGSTPPSQAVARATKTIPVVFNGSGDPVGAGIVPNLEHPGGNVTGTQTLPFSVNQLNVDLLKEIMPGMTRLAIMRSATNPLPGVYDSMKAAAERRGMSTQ